MIETKFPLVSILIPCYNHENFITEAIISCMNQSYENIELIIINDGSTDNSDLIIKSLLRRYSFQYYVQNNKGLIYTLNKLRNIAKGKYISLLASDDYFSIKKIELLVNYLESNPKDSMVYAKMYIVNSTSTVIGQISDSSINKDVFCELLSGSFFINGVTTLIRKEIYMQYKYDISYIEDLQMWLKISKNHKIGFINEYLAYYRKHNNNMSGNLLKMQESEEIIINKYKNENCYNEAINEWNLRWFHNASLCHKNLAIKKYLLRIITVKNLKRIKFYKALIRLFLPCALQRR